MNELVTPISGLSGVAFNFNQFELPFHSSPTLSAHTLCSKRTRVADRDSDGLRGKGRRRVCEILSYFYTSSH